MKTPKHRHKWDPEVQIARTTADMRDALGVRRAVFIEEQGVPEEEEIDAYDGDPARLSGAVHAVAYVNGRAVATGRLLLDTSPAGSAHIGRVAVLREYRRRGLGNAIMLTLQREAVRRGYAGITVAAQLQAMPFYQRLGYQARGDVFLDAGIEHREMHLAL